MSYKVSMNTELVDTESLLLVEFKDRFLWTSGHDIFINSPIYNLVSSVFLFSLKKKKTACLICIVDLFPWTHGQQLYDSGLDDA